MVQYYAQWAVYGRNFFPRDMRLDELTHVHYAFYEINSACEVASIDEYADYQLVQQAAGQSVQGNLAAFRALRAQQAQHGRELKLDLSFGGWTKSTYFSGCAKTADGRSRIVQTSMALLERTGFDGIDVDWEYPVCCGLASNQVDPGDWERYVDLLRELRVAMDAAYPSTHKELTIAMGMGPAVSGPAPKAELGEILDCVNMMTYDYNGAWQTLTAHNTPLYPDPAYAAAGGTAGFSIDEGVREWLKVLPPSKLVLGMAGYGRAWVGTTQQYGQATGGHPGSPPWYENGLLSYWDIRANYVGSSTYTRHWNPISQVPYLTGANSFITYDDEQSVAIKARYARSLGLAGMMWWEASEDKDSVLLQAANDAWAAPSNGGVRRLATAPMNFLATLKKLRDRTR